MEAKRKNSKYFLIAILSLSTLCYTYPYLSSTFYNQFMEAFSLSNEQIGHLLTLFSLTATPGYLFGGLLADKFSPKKLVVVSQLLTASIGLCICFLQGYTILLTCYLGLGISTTFIHWAAYLKLIRAQADEGEEGKIFGFFETCAAVVGIITNYGVLAILGHLSSFRIVQAIYAVILIIVAIVIMLFVKDADTNVSTSDFKLAMVPEAVKHPVTWLNGFIVMGIFMCVSACTYLNPYLSSVFGTSVTFATSFAIINRSIMRILVCGAGGLLLDKLKTPKFLTICSVIGAMIILPLTFVEQTPNAMMTAIIICLAFIAILNMSRSGMYTPIPEVKMPMAITGTAMGICSAIGYSSDLWLYTVCGKWLDTYGNDGFKNIIYLIIASLALIVVCSALLHAYEKKHRVFETE